MTKIFATLLAASVAFVTGCASYDIGSQHDSAPNGSYSESTLNSPVTDQNPHPGGDASFPDSDQGVAPAPPEKSDGR